MMPLTRSLNANSQNKGPHLFSGKPARLLQWQKTAALFPLLLAGLLAHGGPAVRVLGVAVCASLLAEFSGSRFMGRKPSYHDGETLFLGLLTGALLPFSLPAWAVFLAVFFSVFLGREIFGGFGQAPFFPPALGVLVLYLGVPALAQTFDFKQAQSLASLLSLLEAAADKTFFVYYAGSAALEDASLALLILGGIFLAAQGTLRWELPAIYLAIFAFAEIVLMRQPLSHLACGGLWLTAFYGTAHFAGMPLRRPARCVFAVLAALLAAAIPGRDVTLRALAGLLAANACSPWLDVLFLPRTLRASRRTTESL